MTDFFNKCKILGELWANYRDEEKFEEFMEYNDMGLPMSYFIANELVKPTELAERYVNETFDILLGILEVKQDTGFEDLDELLGGSIQP